MPGSLQPGLMDIAFLLIMTAQATAIAYLHQPRWKFAVFSLPLPFTFASLSLGRPIGITHMAGVLLIPAFVYGVTALHYRARVPIVAAIILAAGGYVAVGATLAPVLPDTDLPFALTAGAALVLGLVLLISSRRHHEPGHRSPMAAWAKVPIVAGIVVGLVLSKHVLGGFMALYPIMGTITAYEARHSLRSFCRQVPNIVLAFVGMLVTIRLIQGAINLPAAIAVGWVAYLGVLVPLSWRAWFGEPV